MGALGTVASKARKLLRSRQASGGGPIRTVVSWPARRLDDGVESAFGSRLFSGGLARAIPFSTFIVGAALWLFLWRFAEGMM